MFSNMEIPCRIILYIYLHQNHLSFILHIINFQFSQSWSPFGQPEVGKLTVIKAGPGFHDEKHYDIGPNGKLTEISETPIHKDACKYLEIGVCVKITS